MIYSILMFLFVLDAALLMVVVLLQDSKGQGLGGAFGGGGGQLGTAIFGGRGAADFLGKATTWLGTGFLVLAIVITLHKQERTTAASLLMNDAARDAQQQMVPQTGLPLLPGTSPVAPDPGSAALPDTSGVN
ncbi:preprotein translocase subunit SecG [Gemmatimonadota bacterium]